jgi:hypothetical protein
MTRFGDSLFTLRRRQLPAPDAKLAPAAGQALPGGIEYPQGSIERFQSCVLPIILLSQAWPGARTVIVFIAKTILNVPDGRPTGLLALRFPTGLWTSKEN